MGVATPALKSRTRAAAAMSEPVVRGYRGEVQDLPALLARVRGTRIQLLRADRVYGRDHLVHAAGLAARAFEAGRARSNDIATETLLYAAGERQIGRALALVGLHDGARDVAAVAWDEGALDALAREQGWVRDDGVLAGDDAALDAFGVTPVERAMLPRERWGEFVIERVALVDVLKA